MEALRLAETAAAGAAATWFMDRVDKAIYLAQSEQIHRREAELEDVTGPGQFARTVLRRVLGHNPSREEAEQWGRVAHVSFGVTVALAYPALARRWPWLRAGNGTLYGLLVFPANALVVPALGLTPPSWKFPKETLLRGLGYHLAYGFALETLCRGLRLHDDR